MHSFKIFSVALLAVGALARPHLSSRTTLTEDDIILFSNDGRVEVVDKADYLAQLAETNVTIGRPDTDDSLLEGGVEGNSTGITDITRRCKSYTVYKNNAVSNFLNWDVAMSSVVHAGSTTATVAVTSGYSISNTLSVSYSTDYTLIKDYLSTTFGLTFSQTWTSTYTSAYTFTVPAGKYGVVVSNPKTVRHSGTANTGCVGSTRSTYFQADTYTSKAYGGLSWVDGTISLCTGSSYPVHRCIGSGSIY